MFSLEIVIHVCYTYINGHQKKNTLLQHPPTNYPQNREEIIIGNASKGFPSKGNKKLKTGFISSVESQWLYMWLDLF
jgi:hypothetical protein